MLLFGIESLNCVRRFPVDSLFDDNHAIDLRELFMVSNFYDEATNDKDESTVKAAAAVLASSNIELGIYCESVCLNVVAFDRLMKLIFSHIGSCDEKVTIVQEAHRVILSLAVH